MERQVLLFYSEKGLQLLEKQQLLFKAEQAGMKERDILVRTYQTGTANEAVFKKWNIDPAKEFTFILVGRDGGEKHRSNDCVSIEHLFGLIDAMPMRKNEQKRMKEKE